VGHMRSALCTSRSWLDCFRKRSIPRTRSTADTALDYCASRRGMVAWCSSPRARTCMASHLPPPLNRGGGAAATASSTALNRASISLGHSSRNFAAGDAAVVMFVILDTPSHRPRLAPNAGDSVRRPATPRDRCPEAGGHSLYDAERQRCPHRGRWRSEPRASTQDWTAR
jgi:hypothetical protein